MRDYPKPAGQTRLKPDSLRDCEVPSGVAFRRWAGDDDELSEGLRPELRETLKLLRIYAADVKGTKLHWHLINSVGSPEFPDAEWTNVLLGRAVELDRVFNSLQS